jgi:hypothetical protein
VGQTTASGGRTEKEEDMTILTLITRLAKSVALALALAAFVVPAAQAGDGIVDDWFRDAQQAASQTVPPAYQAGDRLVDDWFRDAQRTALLTVPPAYQAGDRLVDDWFRDGRSGVVNEQLVPLDGWYHGIVAAAPRTLSANRTAAPQSSTDGFGWRDFGIGASSMLGALALLAALGSIALTARRGTRTLGRT